MWEPIIAIPRRVLLSFRQIGSRDEKKTGKPLTADTTLGLSQFRVERTATVLLGALNSTAAIERHRVARVTWVQNVFIEYAADISVVEIG